MTDEERASVRYFKAQLQSYANVKRMVDYCDRRIADIEYQMNQVSGISYDKEVTTHKFDSGAKSVRWYSLSEDKESLLNDRKSYMEQLDSVGNFVCQKLLQMPEKEREIIRRVYLEGATVLAIAHEMNYSESAVRYHINEAIAKAVLK